MMMPTNSKALARREDQRNTARHDAGDLRGDVDLAAADADAGLVDDEHATAHKAIHQFLDLRIGKGEEERHDGNDGQAGGRGGHARQPRTGGAAPPSSGAATSCRGLSVIATPGMARRGLRRRDGASSMTPARAFDQLSRGLTSSHQF